MTAYHRQSSDYDCDFDAHDTLENKLTFPIKPASSFLVQAVLPRFYRGEINILEANYFTSASHSFHHLSLCETVKASAPFALQEQDPLTIWCYASISFSVAVVTKWLKINKTEVQKSLLAISHGDE